MNVLTILTENYSEFQWIQTGADYEGLDWLDESPKPTKVKLQSEWLAVEAKIAADAQAKIDAKASAIAKLQALGLTVQEVEVAFGLTQQ
jgi:hypothetical protein